MVPPSPGSWPVTVTPVRTSMPRFLNDRTTTLATSSSQPGRILGSASRIGDLGAEVGHHRGELAADGAAADDHRGARAALGSTAARRRSRRACRRRRSRGSCGAPNPAARITRVAGELDVARLVRRSTVTVWSACRRAGAVVDRDLAPLEQALEPLPQLVDDLLLAGLGDRPKSRRARRRGRRTPWRRPPCRYTAAVSSSSLAGMQPTVQAGAADLVLLDQGDVEPGGAP